MKIRSSSAIRQFSRCVGSWLEESRYQNEYSKSSNESMNSFEKSSTYDTSIKMRKDNIDETWINIKFSKKQYSDIDQILVKVLEQLYKQSSQGSWVSNKKWQQCKEQLDNTLQGIDEALVEKYFTFAIKKLNAFATQQTEIGNFQIAESVLDQCLQWLQINSKILKSNIKSLLINSKGQIERKKGVFGKAMQCFMKAQKIALEGIFKDYLGVIYLNLSSLCGVLGNHQLALEYANDALIEQQKLVFEENDKEELYVGEKEEEKLERISNLCLSYYNVAIEMEALSRYDDSLKYYEYSYSSAQKYIGNKNPLTFQFYEELNLFKTRLSKYKNQKDTCQIEKMRSNSMNYFVSSKQVINNQQSSNSGLGISGKNISINDELSNQEISKGILNQSKTDSNKTLFHLLHRSLHQNSSPVSNSHKNQRTFSSHSPSPSKEKHKKNLSIPNNYSNNLPLYPVFKTSSIKNPKIFQKNSSFDGIKEKIIYKQDLIQNISFKSSITPLGNSHHHKVLVDYLNKSTKLKGNQYPNSQSNNLQRSLGNTPQANSQISYENTPKKVQQRLITKQVQNQSINSLSQTQQFPQVYSEIKNISSSPINKQLNDTAQQQVRNSIEEMISFNFTSKSSSSQKQQQQQQYQQQFLEKKKQKKYQQEQYKASQVSELSQLTPVFDFGSEVPILKGDQTIQPIMKDFIFNSQDEEDLSCLQPIIGNQNECMKQTSSKFTNFLKKNNRNKFQIKTISNSTTFQDSRIQFESSPLKSISPVLKKIKAREEQVATKTNEIQQYQQNEISNLPRNFNNLTIFQYLQKPHHSLSSNQISPFFNHQPQQFNPLFSQNQHQSIKAQQQQQVNSYYPDNKIISQQNKKSNFNDNISIKKNDLINQENPFLSIIENTDSNKDSTRETCKNSAIQHIDNRLKDMKSNSLPLNFDANSIEYNKIVYNSIQSKNMQYPISSNAIDLSKIIDNKVNSITEIQEQQVQKTQQQAQNQDVSILIKDNSISKHEIIQDLKISSSLHKYSRKEKDKQSERDQEQFRVNNNKELIISSHYFSIKKIESNVGSAQNSPKSQKSLSFQPSIQKEKNQQRCYNNNSILNSEDIRNSIELANKQYRQEQEYKQDLNTQLQNNFDSATNGSKQQFSKNINMEESFKVQDLRFKLQAFSETPITLNGKKNIQETFIQKNNNSRMFKEGNVEDSFNFFNGSEAIISPEKVKLEQGGLYEQSSDDTNIVNQIVSPQLEPQLLMQQDQPFKSNQNLIQTPEQTAPLSLNGNNQFNQDFLSLSHQIEEPQQDSKGKLLGFTQNQESSKQTKHMFQRSSKKKQSVPLIIISRVSSGTEGEDEGDEDESDDSEQNYDGKEEEEQDSKDKDEDSEESEESDNDEISEKSNDDEISEKSNDDEISEESYEKGRQEDNQKRGDVYYNDSNQMSEQQTQIQSEKNNNNNQLLDVEQNDFISNNHPSAQKLKEEAPVSFKKSKETLNKLDLHRCSIETKKQSVDNTGKLIFSRQSKQGHKQLGDIDISENLNFHNEESNFNKFHGNTANNNNNYKCSSASIVSEKESSTSIRRHFDPLSNKNDDFEKRQKAEDNLQIYPFEGLSLTPKVKQFLKESLVNHCGENIDLNDISHNQQNLMQAKNKFQSENKRCSLVPNNLGFQNALLCQQKSAGSCKRLSLPVNLIRDIEKKKIEPSKWPIQQKSNKSESKRKSIRKMNNEMKANNPNLNGLHQIEEVDNDNFINSENKGYLSKIHLKKVTEDDLIAVRSQSDKQSAIQTFQQQQRNNTPSDSIEEQSPFFSIHNGNLQDFSQFLSEQKQEQLFQQKNYHQFEENTNSNNQLPLTQQEQQENSLPHNQSQIQQFNSNPEIVMRNKVFTFDSNFNNPNNMNILNNINNINSKKTLPSRQSLQSYQSQQSVSSSFQQQSPQLNFSGRLSSPQPFQFKQADSASNLIHLTDSPSQKVRNKSSFFPPSGFQS